MSLLQLLRVRFQPVTLCCMSSSLHAATVLSYKGPKKPKTHRNICHINHSGCFFIACSSTPNLLSYSSSSSDGTSGFSELLPLRSILGSMFPPPSHDSFIFSCSSVIILCQVVLALPGFLCLVVSILMWPSWSGLIGGWQIHHGALGARSQSSDIHLSTDVQVVSLHLTEDWCCLCGTWFRHSMFQGGSWCGPSFALLISYFDQECSHCDHRFTVGNVSRTLDVTKKA